MKKVTFIFLLIIVTGFFASAQKRSYAADMAKTGMAIWKDSLSMNGKPAKWTYDQGLFLKGIEGLWYATGDGKYFEYIQKSMDFFVDDNGNIRTYKPDELTLDNITPGRALLLLYTVTGKEKYLKAVQTLRKQLQQQPRTKEGGFWHKKIYPSQMWLDGLYMAPPFYAEYANTFHEDTIFNDIARQFILMEKKSRDIKTGLMYHGYDESRKQKWADNKTGLSPNFWARAMGWYGMGLVDVLENFPDGNPKKKELIAILNRFAAAVYKVQDVSGLWWDILNFPGREKNYLEASASSMFVYTFAKGVRLGYLPATYLAAAKKGYSGLVNQFVKDESGVTNLHGIVSVSGLGGNNPYRDGSYDYYMSEKVVTNDPKGVGAFIVAANEMEMLPTLSYGKVRNNAVAKQKTVLLDNYFNHELKKDVTGKEISWHYTWDEQDNGGYSLFGKIFNRYGAKTKMLTHAPTLQNLQHANVYIIVDPDTEKETAKPSYIKQKDINAIYKWVKDGGVLLLFGNDLGNVDFKHFNQLAKKFGFQFNYDSRNRVTGNKFEMGTLTVSPDNLIFKTAKKIYIKEYASQSVMYPSKAIFTDGDIVVMSVSKIGRGAVFAVGDPWFYNEYLDGRKLPAGIDNYKAAEDLIKWALDQTNKK